MKNMAYKQALRKYQTFKKNLSKDKNRIQTKERVFLGDFGMRPVINVLLSSSTPSICTILFFVCLVVKLSDLLCQVESIAFHHLLNIPDKVYTTFEMTSLYDLGCFG